MPGGHRFSLVAGVAGGLLAGLLLTGLPLNGQPGAAVTPGFEGPETARPLAAVAPDGGSQGCVVPARAGERRVVPGGGCPPPSQGSAPEGAPAAPRGACVVPVVYRGGPPMPCEGGPPRGRVVPVPLAAQSPRPE